MLWLAPKHPEPIIRLIEALVATFPDCPPYCGAHTAIIPHLTIADLDTQTDTEPRIDSIDRAFRSEAGELLPIRARVDSAALFIEEESVWREWRRFPFAG